jgi:hypothetical protein
LFRQASQYYRASGFAPVGGRAARRETGEGGSASFKFIESFMSEHYSMWGVLLGAVEYYLREAVK